MLSAHQPYADYPAVLKQAVIRAGGIAQVAGGVPAMCDGITQGRDGMQLSLYSRDVIAMSTAIALSHDMFDGALMLGVCDKIVPGLLIGALSFGHLPTVFVPAGPMASGLPNGEKARVRQLHAEGKVGREELLEAEAASYHSKGTCTFYGTANSNQLLMEVLGLHLPGVLVRQPRYAAARGAHPGRRRAGGRDHPAGRRAHADRRARRREGDRQRVRRAARQRRLDQPHAAPGRDRAGGRHRAHLGRPVRPVGGGAAAGADLPQRLGRREPLPRRRRRRLPDPHPAARRPAARRRADHLRPRPVAHAREPMLRGERPHLGGGPEGQPRPRRAAAGRRPVRRRRWAEGAARAARHRRDQGVGGRRPSTASSPRPRSSSTTRPSSSRRSPTAGSTASTSSR